MNVTRLSLYARIVNTYETKRKKNKEEDYNMVPTRAWYA